MTCTAPPQSLPKSFVETRERQTIIPHGVPFMVKLLCYYASEDSIFLHLEHVQGERSAASLALMQQLRPRGLGLPYLLAQPFSEGHTVRDEEGLRSDQREGMADGETIGRLRGVVHGAVPVVLCAPSLLLCFPGETLWSHLRAKYRTQQGASPSSDSPCTTAPPVLRGHGGENSEDGAQGSSQGSTDQTASTPSPGLCKQGLVFHTQDCVTAAEAKDCMLARAASQHEPRALSGQTASLTRGRAPAPSGLRRAPASWGHGRTAWAVKEEQVQLWAAEILLALEGLHQQGVLCRDLNPRNLLLDTAGRWRPAAAGLADGCSPRCRGSRAS